MIIIKLQGSFDQHNYMFEDESFETLWDQLNYNLYCKKEDAKFKLPISILSISNIQHSINLIHGLRSIYSLNHQNILFEFSLDNIPSYLDIRILPIEYIDMLEHAWSFMLKKIIVEENTYNGFYAHELTSLEHIIDYMNTGKDLDSDFLLQNRRHFYQIINNYDHANNKNFCAIFPDMINFYELCSKL
jgi:hypothetical protein